MCSNWGCTPGVNFTLHFWHLFFALSRTVCLMLSVRCSYFFLSKLGPLGAPKKDMEKPWQSRAYVFYCLREFWRFLLRHRRVPSDPARRASSFSQGEPTGLATSRHQSRLKVRMQRYQESSPLSSRPVPDTCFRLSKLRASLTGQLAR